MTDRCRILVGDCRERLGDLDAESVQTCVTSPPYWGLRDYGAEEQIGLEETPEAFVEALVAVFREVRRVLRDDGTLWVNLGDTYIGARNGGIGSNSKINSTRNHKAVRHAQRRRGNVRGRAPGLKPKDLVGIPWRVALALQADGWWLRADVIWHKPCPLPESVRDRPSRAHEYLFLLSKSRRYYYDADAIREPQKTAGERHEGRSGYRPDHPSKGGISKRTLRPDGANARSVWTIAQTPYAGAHFATFPAALVEPCILAGAPPDGVVLDPFAGTGTTGAVALALGRRAVLIEAQPDYVPLIEERLRGIQYPLIAPAGATAAGGSP